VPDDAWLPQLRHRCATAAITSGAPASKEDIAVATPDECKIAIVQLAARFSAGDGRPTDRLDRTVSAMITDLGLLFRGHLHDGVLDDIRDAAGSDEAAPAQIRLSMSSDDLLALAAGELSLGSAWLAGRLKVQASFPDILRLRGML
jgi:hypothetical protein